MSLTFQSLRAFLGNPSPPGAMMAFTSPLPAGGGAGEVARCGRHMAAQPVRRRGGDLLAGVVASAGLAVGVTVRMAPAVRRLDDRSRGGAAERAALAQALHEVGRQVLRHLASSAGLAAAGSWAAWPPGAVLLADGLVPADFRAVVQARIAAIVLARGGPASQVTLLAQAAGVPLLVALGPWLQAMEAGHTVVVDAVQGVLELAPDAARLEAARLEAVAQRRRRAEWLAAVQAGARTADGVCIPVSANVADADEAARARRLGAQGVGQLRTEPGFLERATAPSLAAQQAPYQAVLDAVPGCSVAIRTLDLGSGDAPACLPLPAETNPALGLRGIRLGLVHGWLLDAQLDAILTLRPLSAVRVMLPMVVEPAELRRVRARLDELAAVRGVARRVPLGVVIETPAAALLVEALAREADFFCIGSSQLAQYTLCMDRGHPAPAARLDTAACRRVALQARAREDAPSVRALVARQWPWLAQHALPAGAAP